MDSGLLGLEKIIFHLRLSFNNKKYLRLKYKFTIYDHTIKQCTVQHTYGILLEELEYLVVGGDPGGDEHGSEHRLTLRQVSYLQLANFTCSATNEIGTAAANIEIVGNTSQQHRDRR